MAQHTSLEEYLRMHGRGPQPQPSAPMLLPPQPGLAELARSRPLPARPLPLMMGQAGMIPDQNSLMRFLLMQRIRGITPTPGEADRLSGITGHRG